tara:strand:+ start:233 stop:1081 length:849 start_codon:yes stop_codon:yes gene_type:complete
MRELYDWLRKHIKTTLDKSDYIECKYIEDETGYSESEIQEAIKTHYLGEYKKRVMIEYLELNNVYTGVSLVKEKTNSEINGYRNPVEKLQDNLRQAKMSIQVLKKSRDKANENGSSEMERELRNMLVKTGDIREVVKVCEIRNKMTKTKGMDTNEMNAKVRECMSKVYPETKYRERKKVKGKEIVRCYEGIMFKEDYKGHEELKNEIQEQKKKIEEQKTIIEELKRTNQEHEIRINEQEAKIEEQHAQIEELEDSDARFVAESKMDMREINELKATIKELQA